MIYQLIPSGSYVCCPGFAWKKLKHIQIQRSSSFSKVGRKMIVMQFHYVSAWKKYLFFKFHQLVLYEMQFIVWYEKLFEMKIPIIF